MKRTSTLQKEFAAAEKRVDKLFNRYRNLIDSLWVETATGQLVHATPRCYQAGGVFREFATDCYDKFFRRGRGVKRYAESWGEFRLFSCVPVDFDAVKKLECAIKKAVTAREALRDELESRGVDTYKRAV